MYTVIAYKADSSDSVMGCLQASWGSDIKMCQTLSQENVINFIINIDSLKRDKYEGGWDYLVLSNGIVIYGDSEFYVETFNSDYEFRDDETDDFNSEFRYEFELKLNTAISEAREARKNAERLVKEAEQKRKADLDEKHRLHLIEQDKIRALEIIRNNPELLKSLNEK